MLSRRDVLTTTVAAGAGLAIIGWWRGSCRRLTMLLPMVRAGIERLWSELHRAHLKPSLFVSLRQRPPCFDWEVGDAAQLDRLYERG